jgi:hypothetical protein
LSDRSSLSGRSSLGRQNSNEALVVNDHARRRTDSRRKCPEQTERSRPFGDDKILQKIKMDNLLFKENTMKAIKEKHIHLDENHLDSGHKENIVGNKNNMVDIPKPEPMKSFYV